MFEFDECPRCAAARNELHENGCPWCWCKTHGGQMLMCAVGDGCAPTTFMGFQHGVQEAIERDWFALADDNGWTSCSASVEGSVPDRNKVILELTWNSSSEKLE